jgi:hypothetical protein
LWRLVSRDGELGELVTTDGTLRYLVAIDAGSVGASRWAVVDSLPIGVAPYLLTKAIHETLTRSEATPTGAILFDGAAFALGASWDGARPVVTLDRQ